MSDELDPVLDAAAAAGESDVSAADLPAFANVVARARDLSPGTFDPAAVAVAEGLHLDVPAEDDTWLRPFLEAATAVATEDIDRHLEPGLPPLRARPHRRRIAIAATAIVAAAAALLLIITGLETWQPTRTEDDAKAAAAMQVEGQGRGGEAVNNEAEETTPQTTNASAEPLQRGPPPPPSRAPARTRP